MNPEEDCPSAKISYEKPTAVDLGPAAPVAGGSCAPGEGIGSIYEDCAPVGNSASPGWCHDGNSAVSQYGCSDGNGAVGGSCGSGAGFSS